MTRKTLFFVLLLAVTLLLCTGTAEAKQKQFGQVTAEDVNLRQLPDTESPSIQKLTLGTEVEILAEQDEWYKVIVNNEVGYVLSKLVFVDSVSERIAYVTEDGINLRGGPGQSAYIVGKLVGGRAVKVKDIIGEWYFVSAEGQTGFVHRKFLIVTKTTGQANVQLLKFDMVGQEVKRMQKELARRGFLSTSHATGTYGAITRAAVIAFQKAAKLPADGVAGAQTLKMIYDRTNKIQKGLKKAADFKGRVAWLPWYSGGSSVIRRSGGVFTITDVRTGKQFNCRRTGGTKHADVEPLTARDTEIFRSIVGKWTWSRRAIWVTVGSRSYAASMNCMPHMPNPTKSNNFPGHFCVHFPGSKTHGGNNVDPDHARMMKYAYDKSK